MVAETKRKGKQKSIQNLICIQMDCRSYIMGFYKIHIHTYRKYESTNKIVEII